MRNLLDTHSLIWFLDGSARLSPIAYRLTVDPQSTLCISAASLWEIAIKIGTGKLRLAWSYREFVEFQVPEANLEVINIQSQHLITLSELPLIHRDPFDRMLIAQAIAEDIPIISVDTALDAYPVTRIW